MKQLITANTVRDVAEKGQKTILISPGSIVTPAAVDEAKQYGVEFDFSPQAGQADIAAQGAAAVNAINQTILQKIVQEVLRQLTCIPSDVVVDPGGLVYIKTGQREFLPCPGEPKLKKKTILAKKENLIDIDAALMLLEAGEILYASPTTELVLVMEGCLNCTVDGREYIATPNEAVVLPAAQELRLLTKQQTTWLSVKIKK